MQHQNNNSPEEDENPRAISKADLRLKDFLSDLVFSEYQVYDEVSADGETFQMNRPTGYTITKLSQTGVRIDFTAELDRKFWYEVIGMDEWARLQQTAFENLGDTMLPGLKRDSADDEEGDDRYLRYTYSGSVHAWSYGDVIDQAERLLDAVYQVQDRTEAQVASLIKDVIATLGGSAGVSVSSTETSK